MKEERIARRFSLPLKLDLVKQIENGSLTACQVSKIYSVSTTSVYRWLRKYSQIYKNQKRVIVEDKSLSKKNKELAEKIKKLEQALGQKQMRIDYLERVVSHASKEVGEDLEKKSKRQS